MTDLHDGVGIVFNFFFSTIHWAAFRSLSCEIPIVEYWKSALIECYDLLPKPPVPVSTFPGIFAGITSQTLVLDSRLIRMKFSER